MLMDIVREFVSVSKEVAVRGERLNRAVWLMCELRRASFSSGEISELSGDRWGDSTIRGYTSGYEG
jgi:hypothetical protein